MFGWPSSNATSGASWSMPRRPQYRLPQVALPLAKLQSLQRSTTSQLATIEAHYRAWRATTITTVEESFEFRVALAELPTTLPDQGWRQPASIKSASAPGNLQELWECFGAGVKSRWVTNARTPQPWDCSPGNH